jgi:hypothetical protein
MAAALPLAAFIIPVAVCWLTGTTPAIARMLIGAGILLYISRNVLKTYFSRKGVAVPGWVTVPGQIGTGLAPGGIAILLLLSLGLIARA